MSQTDCYQVLGIANAAAVGEIKKAFRRLAKELHPDKGGDAAKFRQLKAAYEEALRYAPSIGSKDEPQFGWKPPRSYSRPNNGYDPFADPDYGNYVFFEPSHPNSADFERHMRAKGCTRCNGRGYVSKIVEPDKGFLGMQDRLCKCQVVGIKDVN